MPETRSERASVAQLPPATTRHLRLVVLLAEMLPEARIIRVSQREPGQTWPSPYARAYDAQGHLVPLKRAQSLTVARWVMRACSGANWNEGYALDLATGIVRMSTESRVATAGGR
ncbi:hypothetical protein ACFVTY_09130 [Streptomyces sp. NPDC058067]|uniref:hypothetical protein n=1 Tax=Streptomyces sp. NPDC058067 TaxID=3346324 RepID=UPI0036E2DF83